MAYYRIEPWGEWPAWLRHAATMAHIANQNPYRKKGQAAKPDDFLPTF